MKKLEKLKKEGEAPEWMTEEAYKTLEGGYLLPSETPKGMYHRVSNAAASRLADMKNISDGRIEFINEMSKKFFDLMWKNWLCPASPVLSNMGTTRGLPISCFGNYIDDSVDGIMNAMHETAMMTKNGGGVGSHWSDVRCRGSEISGNGQSNGVIPFMKILDSTIIGISQGGVRRGAGAAYLDIEHGDFDEFINMRRPVGDPNRQCLNLHHAVCVSDSFMEKVRSGDQEARRRWREVIKSRAETGEPFIFFTDNVNRANPESYKNLGLTVKGSNICTEITLFTDSSHSFVCCLSSMNLARWDEWKDTDAVRLSIKFLDAVMEEFIVRAGSISGMEKSVNFARKSRALGLGVLGFHTLIQNKGMAFDSLDAYLLNNIIFKKIHDDANAASRELAEELGEPEWCKGTGKRNTHLIAVAPTASNSIISGGYSSGIEPITANAYALKTAKGTFLRKNQQLERLLEEKGKNTDEVWRSIVVNEGSVQHLDFLSSEEKKLFETAREMNQFVLVKLAAARQRWIDQAQSLNLFFPANVEPKYFNEVHMTAHELGIKTLYYCRSTSVLKGDSGFKTYKRELNECSYCEG